MVAHLIPSSSFITLVPVLKTLKKYIWITREHAFYSYQNNTSFKLEDGNINEPQSGKDNY